jgi:hypothetical protein
MDSIRATGAKVSSKSMPSRCTKLCATKRALCLTMAPASSLFSLSTHFKGDRVVTTREISKLSGAVLLNCVHLRLHRGTPCRVSLGLCEGPRLTVIARKMQLRLQIVRGQSWHRLVTEKVLHRMIPQRLVVVVRVDALLVVGEQSSKLHRVLNMSWCQSGRARRDGRRCWSAWGRRLWWWWRRPRCNRGRGWRAWR